MNNLWLVAVVLMVMLLLPFTIFFCVKMGASAYFIARRRYRGGQENRDGE